MTFLDRFTAAHVARDLRGDRCVCYREFFDRTATLRAQGIAPGTVARIVAQRSEIRILPPESAMLSP